ncbi:unnamed protein product [Blepharisma stoltei]|uniref:Uncharacterized protein n=1 Tax=Blepharisma stoltei TaxID=1481888 RepID=A0AAU9J7E1_9CILI|nr:unnamed protein product [Blepharisma stoltei]
MKFYKMSLFLYDESRFGPAGIITDGGGFPVSSLGKSFTRLSRISGQAPPRNTLCLLSENVSNIWLPGWDLMCRSVRNNINLGGGVSCINLMIGFDPSTLS